MIQPINLTTQPKICSQTLEMAFSGKSFLLSFFGATPNQSFTELPYLGEPLNSAPF
jgi:hypothetical protein